MQGEMTQRLRDELSAWRALYGCIDIRGDWHKMGCPGTKGIDYECDHDCPLTAVEEGIIRREKEEKHSRDMLSKLRRGRG